MLKEIVHRLKQSKVLIGLGYLSAAQAMTILGKLLVGIYVANYMGAAVFGSFTTAVAMFWFLIPLSLNPAASLAVREMATYPNQKAEIFGTYRLLRWSFSSLAFVIHFTSSFALAGEVGTLLRIMSVTWFFLPAQGIEQWYVADVNMKPAFYANTIMVAIASLLKIWAVTVGLHITWFAWIFVLEQAIKSAVLWVIFHRHSSPQLSYSWRWTSRLLTNLYKVLILNFLNSLRTHIDQVLVYYLLGDLMAGQYGLAMTMFDALFFFGESVKKVFVPTIAKSRRKSQEVYHAQLVRLYRVLLGVGALMSLLVFLLGEWLIKLAFSPSFHHAGYLLSIMFPTTILLLAKLGKNIYLSLENDYTHPILADAPALVVKAIVILLVWQYMGIEGFILSTYVALAFSVIVVGLADSRTRGHLLMIAGRLFQFATPKP